MKSIRLVALALILALSGSVMAHAAKLNEAEKAAQKKLVEFLRTQKYSPTIDSKDQSVCFKRNGVLYWIEVKGSAGSMLYTLNRNGIKFTTNDDPKASQKIEVAQMAANKINETHIVKSYQKGGTVRFSMSMYAATPEAFEAGFKAQLSAFDNIKEDFDRYYKLCRVKVDSIHSHWYDLDSMVVVMEQKNVQRAKSLPNLAISHISVRNVDANDNVISDYDQGIRKSKIAYLQEKVYLTAKENGVYKIGVKIYTPDGKLLLPSKDATFTTITTVNVKKANKEVEFELNKFGSRDSDDWAPGEYRIEFYEDDTCIYKDEINIL